MNSSILHNDELSMENRTGPFLYCEWKKKSLNCDSWSINNHNMIKYYLHEYEISP